MNDGIKVKTISKVMIQENGIIRNSNGLLIGRLTSDIDFKSEDINEVDNIKNSLEILTGEMQDTELGSYAHGWHCNIAMSCFDAILETKKHVAFDSYSDYHYASNEAASRFMKLLFNVTTKNE
jgi:hypothetical protein